MNKMEDIANLAGGQIVVQLTATDEQHRPSNQALRVKVDGEVVELASGGTVHLEAGQSICIPPRTIHQFWGAAGSGISVSTEVSSVCDDLADNVFLQPATRFPLIQEGQPRRYYLCTEYPRSDTLEAV